MLLWGDNKKELERRLDKLKLALENYGFKICEGKKAVMRITSIPKPVVFFVLLTTYN